MDMDIAAVVSLYGPTSGHGTNNSHHLGGVLRDYGLELGDERLLPVPESTLELYATAAIIDSLMTECMSEASGSPNMDACNMLPGAAYKWGGGGLSLEDFYKFTEDLNTYAKAFKVAHSAFWNALIALGVPVTEKTKILSSDSGDLFVFTDDGTDS